jgi:hypothetical protein
MRSFSSIALVVADVGSTIGCSDQAGVQLARQSVWAATSLPRVEKDRGAFKTPTVRNVANLEKRTSYTSSTRVLITLASITVSWPAELVRLPFPRALTAVWTLAAFACT